VKREIDGLAEQVQSLPCIEPVHPGVNGPGSMEGEAAVDSRFPAVIPSKRETISGFLATLTPEQRQRALAYRGDDSIGGEVIAAKASLL